MKSLLRQGRVESVSRREWENSRALERAGIAVAGLIAYGEECGPLWEKFSFIITESAPGQTMEQFLGACRDRARRRDVFDALARFVRQMHDAGLATPDLFTRHIFVDTENGDPVFCLIDMARLDRRTRLPERLRARDLAALNVTAPLRLPPRANACASSINMPDGGIGAWFNASNGGSPFVTRRKSKTSTGLLAASRIEDPQL